MDVFKSLVQEPDLGWQFVDSSIAKAHQHSANAAGLNDEAVGESVARNTRKIQMAANEHGLSIDFTITGSEAHDCKAIPGFIAQLPSANYRIADKGYDRD